MLKQPVLNKAAVKTVTAAVKTHMYIVNILVKAARKLERTNTAIQRWDIWDSQLFEEAKMQLLLGLI